MENLTGRRAIKGEKVPAVFGFDAVIATNLRAKVDDAEQGLSEGDIS